MIIILAKFSCLKLSYKNSCVKFDVLPKQISSFIFLSKGETHSEVKDLTKIPLLKFIDNFKLDYFLYGSFKISKNSFDDKA